MIFHYKTKILTWWKAIFSLTNFSQKAIRDVSGATAVEFALICGPLFIAIFGTIEVALYFLVTSTLQAATAEVAREIRTGQLGVSAPLTAAGLTTAICNKMTWLKDQCPGKLSLNVQTFANYASMTAPNPISGGNFQTNALTVGAVSSGSIVMIKTYYQWEITAPFIGSLFGALNNGSVVITAVSAFRNEPY